MSQDSFEITFVKEQDLNGKRIVWRRFYVPWMSRYACLESALNAMRAEYPNARLLFVNDVFGGHDAKCDCEMCLTAMPTVDADGEV